MSASLAIPDQHPTRLVLRALPDCEPTGPACDDECWREPLPRWHTPLPPPRRPTLRVVGGDASLTEANALLHRLVGALLEVMAGRRPLHALYGTMTAPVYESMRTWMRSLVDPAAHYRLNRLHTSSPDTGVVELCATVRLRAPGRALMVLAGRFERRGPTWRLTALRPLV